MQRDQVDARLAGHAPGDGEASGRSRAGYDVERRGGEHGRRGLAGGEDAGDHAAHGNVLARRAR